MSEIYINSAPNNSIEFILLCVWAEPAVLGSTKTALKIQIRNLNRLLHIYNSMYGAGYKLEKQKEKPMI